MPKKYTKKRNIKRRYTKRKNNIKRRVGGGRFGKTLKRWFTKCTGDSCVRVKSNQVVPVEDWTPNTSPVSILSASPQKTRRFKTNQVVPTDLETSPKSLLSEKSLKTLNKLKTMRTIKQNINQETARILKEREDLEKQFKYSVSNLAVQYNNLNLNFFLKILINKDNYEKYIVQNERSDPIKFKKYTNGLMKQSIILNVTDEKKLKGYRNVIRKYPEFFTGEIKDLIEKKIEENYKLQTELAELELQELE